MFTSGSSQVELEKNMPFFSYQSEPIEEPSEAQPYIPIQVKPRHSGKVTRIPKRWIGEIFDLVSKHQEQDPTRYEEAIADLDADKCLKAINV
jgi:hypothetical protein